ncbi:hypothetical protein [Hymenobacter norwichensis]|uniref:hypothetical protein n=1 Tax=Hymenobacter norwichensis TaxID=223903 RepID=UPI0008FF93DF|nr:hypothetical protein [Hymenobacter norwichensis]
MYFIIDTNVPLTANNASSAGPECVRAAIARILQLQSAEILVLDDNFLILREYQNKLNTSGQPGLGDAFLLWALRNHTNSAHCSLVHLLVSIDGNFTDFPSDPRLISFDPSDRKFVAAARAHHANPPIVNATDSDWYHDRVALTENGVQLEFICPQEMTLARRT